MRPHRVAAVYDIHGNLPALQAVLREIPWAEVDHLLVGGDVVPGPMPVECLETLLDLDLPTTWIAGNGERATLALAAGRTPADVPEAFRSVIEWVAEQLTPELVEVMTAWPQTARMTVAETDVLFCHATPDSDMELVTGATPEERARRLFEPADAALVVCGHTHMPYDRQLGGVRVVNAGSVGMPFGGTGADWLLVGSAVEARHTEFDLGSAAATLRATDYPQAEHFASANVLTSPDAEEMTAVFERAAEAAG